MDHLRYILDTACPIPLSKRALMKHLVILGFHQMTAKPKQLVYHAITGEKSLSYSMGFKSSHFTVIANTKFHLIHRKILVCISQKIEPMNMGHVNRHPLYTDMSDRSNHPYG